jgi:clorobiocin/coumermycin A biosynthesis protein CloN6/CouN6
MQLPVLSADLLLIHAPAFFDFRERRDIYFPFLGTSGDVPITPLYEYFPFGFKTLQRYLEDRGHGVKILNLSSLLIRYPQLKIEDIFAAVDARLIGIDLHWMIHVQGSLAVAETIKRVRPDLKTVFGGISSTYYAKQLIQYPFIDMVMQGYDTHEPVDALLSALKTGRNLRHIPNLVWKTSAGDVEINGLTYLPETFSCGADWSKQPEAPSSQNSVPILEVLSTQNAGCAYNCGWCGGSREAFRRIYGKQRAMARKPVDEVRYEFETLSRLPRGKYHFYAVGSYNETREGMNHFLDRVGEANLKSISYEQFHLTPDDVLKRMARANRRTIITLSPESHDPRVAKLAGRGVYTNEEMEQWIPRALDAGIFQIDIWYFVGMPQQNEASVMETVEYCERLLRLFKDKRVNPMVCPMIPFLDPASTFFEHPETHGFKVFYRSVEEHRRGMERASIINRTNYETDYLSRSDLVYVGYKAVRRLMEAKAEFGALPKGIVNEYLANVDDALGFIGEVHAADIIKDPRDRASALEALGDDILRRNNKIFFSGVANQAYPINRQIGGRWFDELGWTVADLDRASGAELITSRV